MTKPRGYNSSFVNEHTMAVASVYDGMSNRSGGRKIAKWSVTVPGPDGNIQFYCDVNILPATMKNRKDEAKPLRFTVDNPYGGRLEHSDIQQLKEMLVKDVSEKVHLITNVTWEDWLCVRVEGSDSTLIDSSMAGMGAELKIKVTPLKRGLHPETGQALTIHRNNVVVPFPRPQKISNTGTDKDWRYEAGEVSYIPATDANIKAIDAIRMKLIQLKLNLAEFLSEEKVEHTLENINKIPLISE